MSNSLATRSGQTAGTAVKTFNPRPHVAVVSATAPQTRLGRLWLDTDATGTGGSGVLSVSTITADTTLTTSQTVVLCDTSLGDIVVTLPEASSSTGRLYHIKKVDSSANTVTIDGDGNQTIDGGLTAVITIQYESISLVCNGSNWNIL